MIIDGCVSNVAIKDNKVHLTIVYYDKDNHEYKENVVQMDEYELAQEFVLAKVDVSTDGYNFSWRFK